MIKIMRIFGIIFIGSSFLASLFTMSVVDDGGITWGHISRQLNATVVPTSTKLSTIAEVDARGVTQSAKDHFYTGYVLGKASPAPFKVAAQSPTEVLSVKESLKQIPQPLKTPEIVVDQIKTIVRDYLADPNVREMFRGFQGIQGIPGVPEAQLSDGLNSGDGGQRYSPILYVPPNPVTGFNGSSLLAATELSSTNFTTKTANITETATIKTLTVTGSATLSGDLSVTGTLNPGFTTGSIAFQGASGLTQDNTGLFYDNTNNRLGLGTTSPSGVLDIRQGTNGNTFIYAERITDTIPTGDFILYKSAAGSNLYRVDNSGNVTAGGTITGGAQTITATTNPQLKVQYDATNEWTSSTSSTGTSTFAFTGTTPRGIWLPSANATNSFQFQNASGTNILDIDTTNERVGIGTTTPSVKMHIVNGAGTLPTLFGDLLVIQNNIASGDQARMNLIGKNDGYSVVGFGDDDSSTVGQIAYDHTLNTMAFRTNGNGASNQMYLNSSGSLGIGTTSPVAKLHSLFTTEQLRLGYDASNYWSSTVGSTGLLTLQGVGTGGALTLSPTAGQNLNVNLSTTGDLAVNTNQLYVDTSAGNVGIGTASPGYKLDVSGGAMRLQDTWDQTTDAPTGGIVFSDSGGVGNDVVIARDASSNLVYQVANTLKHSFKIQGTEYFAVSQSGPTAASMLLTGTGLVSGTTGLMFIDNGGTGNDVGIWRDSANSAGMFYHAGGSNGFHQFTIGDTIKMIINSSGTVDIGGALTPLTNTLLSVAQASADTAIQLGQDTTHSMFMQWVYNATPANAYLNLQTYGHDNTIRIGPVATGGIFIDTDTNSGNVGVGNTSPQKILHVGSSSVTDGTALLRLQDANSTCDFTADIGASLCGSDETLKKDINSLDISVLVGKVSALRPVSYRWKTDGEDAPAQYGFIAQEVGTQFPDLVKDGVWVDGSQKKFLNTGGLMPYVVGTTKGLAESLQHIGFEFIEGEENYVSADTETGLLDILAEPVVLAYDYLSEKMAKGAKVTKELFARKITAILGVFDSIFAKSVDTERLCVADATGSKTCITKADLDRLILRQSQNVSSVRGGGSMVERGEDDSQNEPLAPERKETLETADEISEESATQINVSNPVLDPVP